MNNTFLDNQWTKWKLVNIKMEISKYFDINEITQYYKSYGTQLKHRGLMSTLKKEETSQINNWIFHLEILCKEVGSKLNPKNANGRK